MGTNFHDSFFGYIRSLHSARVMGDNFDRLCVIVVTTNPAFLITNPNTSPFNNGPFIHLDDFSKDEIIELSQTYELIIDESDVAELMDLLNGHPYLTHLTFELLSSKQFSWKELKSIALTENSPFIIHLQQISRFIQHKPYLRNTLKTIINIGSYSDEFALFQLEQIGLVTRNRCRCNLYKSYFADKLLSNLDLDTISVTDEERQGIESLLKAQRRRLHKLQEQVATMGSYTPPHILTEIEDLQTEITRSETLLSTITGISQ